MKDEIINEVIKETVKISNPVKIILFGSTVTGKNKDDSDLDLLILKKNILHRRKMAQKIYLNLNIGISVDIIVETPERYNMLKENPFLIYNEIFKTGKVVYEQ